MPDLATFFREKKGQRLDEEKRRQDVRQQWEKDLRALFADIRTWLQPAAVEGLEVEECDHRVEEGLLGTYDAPALRLRFGAMEARIIPVGRYIVGGTGRVDVEFPGDRVLLVREGRGGRWHIVREDRSTKLPLSQDTFAEIIQDAFSQ